MIFIFIRRSRSVWAEEASRTGRTIGKAITEFRRASSDLKATFEREMQSLERESESLKEVTHSAATDIHSHTSYEYPYYDSGAYGSDPYDSTATNPSTVSASAVPGAESHGTTETATNQSWSPGIRGRGSAARRGNRPSHGTSGEGRDAFGGRNTPA